MSLFGLFKRPKPDPERIATLRELDDRVYKLERRVKDLDVEWNDQQEKFIRLLSRASKRLKAAHEADQEAAEAPRMPVEAKSPFQTTNPMAMRIMGRTGA